MKENPSNYEGPMMPESGPESAGEGMRAEREKHSEASPVTVWVVRHGESTTDKFDPRRGLTEKGEGQARAAGKRIADEIMASVGTGDVIELRGYDSGMERANQTLLVTVVELVKAGYTVNIPENSLPPFESDDVFDTIDKTKIQLTGGEGIQKRIKNVGLSDEARKHIKRFEAGGGEGPVMTWLKEPEDILAEKGAELPRQVRERMAKGIATTEKLARRVRERDPHRKIFVVAASHSGTIEPYLGSALGMSVDELGEVENAEGFKVSFSGEKDEAPTIEAWGPDTEEKVRRAKSK